MKTILKWTSIALMTTMFMYCVQGISGYKPNNDASADAGISDASVTQDASVIYVQCEPCIKKYTYTETTDASGVAEFEIPNWNPNGEYIIQAWFDSESDGNWGKLNPRFDEEGYWQFTIMDTMGDPKQGVTVKVVIIE